MFGPTSAMACPHGGLFPRRAATGGTDKHNFPRRSAGRAMGLRPTGWTAYEPVIRVRVAHRPARAENVGDDRRRAGRVPRPDQLDRDGPVVGPPAASTRSSTISGLPVGPSWVASKSLCLTCAHSRRCSSWRPLLLVGYVPRPPSTGRPVPVMNRDASEARKTMASATSSTSPSRPSGVDPMT